MKLFTRSGSIRMLLFLCLASNMIFSAQSACAQSYELLILAPEEFEDALIPLKTFKDITQRPTLLATLEEVYAQYTGHDKAEQVKKYIAFCEEKYGVRYVMLVGDSDKFPVRYFYLKVIDAYNDGIACVRYIPTDWYYSDLYYEGTKDFCSWDSNENGFYGEMILKYPDPNDRWAYGNDIVVDHI